MSYTTVVLQSLQANSVGDTSYFYVTLCETSIASTGPV